MTYDNWLWGTSCTNTLFGAVPEENATAVTLINPTPACSTSSTNANVLTITMTEDLTASDWSTFFMTF